MLKTRCWEVGKSQTFVIQLMTWWSTDFWQFGSSLPFRPASTLSPFCPTHCAMTLYAASVNFQFANARFLLNVGGLGLCISFQEHGPHSQGTKSTWHSSWKWDAAPNGYREALEKIVLSVKPCLLHASLVREPALLEEGQNKSVQEILFQILLSLAFCQRVYERQNNAQSVDSTSESIWYLKVSWKTRPDQQVYN